ncbi:MAG TPA: aminopeptidase N C-terminal domain-containing protein, partial [Caulobacter sp.]|nr:aminopeptidase N C-terminal domain-containing protein [Caulobacter sp.]
VTTPGSLAGLFEFLDDAAPDALFGYNHPGREPGALDDFSLPPSHFRHLQRRMVALEAFNRREDFLFQPRLGGPFSPLAEAAGRRALRNAALDLLSVDSHAENVDIAARHFETAANMTDAIGGLAALMALGGDGREKALETFHARWKDEPLVLDKWFAIQARDSSDEALGRVLGLTVHPDFDRRNPNRLRALVGTFASFNPARFHDPSGAGYRFLADQIIATDKVNPMTAARFIEPLGGWRRYQPELGALMKAQLERIVAVEGLSKNVFELASKALA